MRGPVFWVNRRSRGLSGRPGENAIIDSGVREQIATAAGISMVVAAKACRFGRAALDLASRGGRGPRKAKKKNKKQSGYPSPVMAGLGRSSFSNVFAPAGAEPNGTIMLKEGICICSLKVHYCVPNVLPKVLPTEYLHVIKLPTRRDGCPRESCPPPPDPPLPTSLLSAGSDLTRTRESGQVARRGRRCRQSGGGGSQRN